MKYTCSLVGFPEMSFSIPESTVNELPLEYPVWNVVIIAYTNRVTLPTLVEIRRLNE